MAQTGCKRLVCLIGAHKTASTHLQHSLMAAERQLADMGIALIGPKEMRKTITPISLALRDDGNEKRAISAANAFIDERGQDAHTIILMDENVIGGTDRPTLIRKGRLYPWAPGRIARLLALLSSHQTDLGLAVRAPATFLPSCWSESLRHANAKSFEDYLETLDLDTLHWSGLIRRIQQKSPDLSLTLWRYEDYETLFPTLIEWIVGPDAAAYIAPDPKRRRPGMSNKAAQWLRAQPEQNRDTMLEARKRFPRKATEDAFVPWESDIQDRLDAAYARDLERLQKTPDVPFLSPAQSRT